MTADGTRIVLTYVPDRINVWLRFGRPRAELILDAWRRVIELSPHVLCCRVRWEANAFGTVEWRVSVFRTCAPGEPLQRIVGLAPGALLLLDAAGSMRVTEVMRLIDRMEAAGIDPADSSPDYWRVVHQRLCVRTPPPEYTHERHAAYLRREVSP